MSKRKSNSLFVVDTKRAIGSTQSTTPAIDASLEDFLGGGTGSLTMNATVSIPRILFLIGVFLLVSIAFVFRSGYLQIMEHESFSALAIRNQYRQVVELPPRGRIFDKSGLILASNEAQFVLSMTIDELSEDSFTRENDIRRIIELTGLNRADVDLPLTENIDFTSEPVVLLSDIPYETAIRLSTETSHLDGFDLEMRSKRVYEKDRKSVV